MATVLNGRYSCGHPGHASLPSTVSLRRILNEPIRRSGPGRDQVRRIPSVTETTERSAIVAGSFIRGGMGSPFFPHPAESQEQNEKSRQ